MCEFLSWIVKYRELYYLTSAELATERGKALKEELKDDICGHSAIMKYFDMGKYPDDEGLHKEETDFSSPDNFPPKIAADIKAGRFAGIALVPFAILSRTLCSSYVNRINALYDYYRFRRPMLYSEYRAEHDALNAEMWGFVSDPANRSEAWQ